MPIDAATWNSAPATRKGSASAATISPATRSATATGSSSRSASSSRNSSPPCGPAGRWRARPRAGGSPGRRSSSSPAAWPSESLTSLKPSRPMWSSATPAPVAPRARQRELEVLLEQRPVGQRGERVVVGEVGDLLLGAAALRHVLAGGQRPDRRAVVVAQDDAVPGDRRVAPPAADRGLGVVDLLDLAAHEAREAARAASRSCSGTASSNQSRPSISDSSPPVTLQPLRLISSTSPSRRGPRSSFPRRRGSAGRGRARPQHLLHPAALVRLRRRRSRYWASCPPTVANIAVSASGSAMRGAKNSITPAQSSPSAIGKATAARGRRGRRPGAACCRRPHVATHAGRRKAHTRPESPRPGAIHLPGASAKAATCGPAAACHAPRSAARRRRRPAARPRRRASRASRRASPGRARTARPARGRRRRGRSPPAGRAAAGGRRRARGGPRARRRAGARARRAAARDRGASTTSCPKPRTTAERSPGRTSGTDGDEAGGGGRRGARGPSPCATGTARGPSPEYTTASQPRAQQRGRQRLGAGHRLGVHRPARRLEGAAAIVAAPGGVDVREQDPERGHHSTVIGAARAGLTGRARGRRRGSPGPGSPDRGGAQPGAQLRRRGRA